jgi:hypothetical protein
MAPTQSEEHPEFPNRNAGWLIPIPDPGSVTSPPGWRVQIGGAGRVPTANYTPEDITFERYAITWYPPRPRYGGPLDVTGADAGQRLSGFSVRVPQDSTVGPGSLGTLANYTSGDFEVDLWNGPNFYDPNQKIRQRGKIVVSPSMEVAFTLNPNDVNQVAPSSFVSVTANVTPLVYGEPSPLIRLESIVCWGDCQPNEGVLDAVFGSDDRAFRLQAAHQPPGNRLPFGRRLYDVTYSVTDVAGTRRLVTSTVTIVSKQYVYTTLPIPGSGRTLTR